MSEIASFKNKAAQKFLKDIIDRTTDIEEKDKKIIGIISSVVFQDVIDHFEKESGPNGKWKSWSEKYAAFMNKIGRGGNKILQDTGRLRGSFQPTNYRIDGDSLVWYNPAKTSKGFPYAYAHDVGGEKLPPREFMWLSAKALGKIEDQILKYVES